MSTEVGEEPMLCLGPLIFQHIVPANHPAGKGFHTNPIKKLFAKMEKKASQTSQEKKNGRSKEMVMGESSFLAMEEAARFIVETRAIEKWQYRATGSDKSRFCITRVDETYTSKSGSGACWTESSTSPTKSSTVAPSSKQPRRPRGSKTSSRRLSQITPG